MHRPLARGAGQQEGGDPGGCVCGARAGIRPHGRGLAQALRLQFNQLKARMSRYAPFGYPESVSWRRKVSHFPCRACERARPDRPTLGEAVPPGIGEQMPLDSDPTRNRRGAVLVAWRRRS